MRIQFLVSRAAVFLALLISGVAAKAASISYGNSPIVAPGLQFFNVTESSSTDPVPLFSAPSYFASGIDFNPASFGASGSGGGSDITDGQLNFAVAGTFTPSSIVTINQININEGGDYTLAGIGTAATQVIAGVSIHVKVTEIDGVAASINLVPSSASTSLNLIANPGIVLPWALGTTLDIASQLTAMNVSFVYGATKVEVVIDNNLIALSEAASAALIAKKDFTVEIDPEVAVVPEPALASAAALGAVLLVVRRRARAK
jgi:hypothetical protein